MKGRVFEWIEVGHEDSSHPTLSHPTLLPCFERWMPFLVKAVENQIRFHRPPRNTLAMSCAQRVRTARRRIV